jgi:hypothetical protein
VTADEMQRMRARAEIVMADVVLLATERGVRTFATGDRGRSIVCLTQHLTPAELYTLRETDRFACPHCNWLLKDRGL